jgi:putative ABC transport system permease protein
MMMHRDARGGRQSRHVTRTRTIGRLGTAVRQAITTARGHLLRSSLASLAVATAVATMLLVTAGLDGVKNYALAVGARTVGSNTFVIAQVVPGQLSRQELAERLRRNPPIRRSDVRYLERVAGDAILVAPTTQRSADVTAGGRTYEAASVNGTTADLSRIRDLDIGAGRFFLPAEDQQAAQVAVIGHEVATTLYPAADPLGQTMRIGGRGFRIIGLVRPQGTGGGVSLDRYVYIPLTAFERVFGAPASLQVFAAGRDLPFEEAEGAARAGLRARRQLPPGRPDTFDILSPEAARSFVLRLAGSVGAAALPIALMALLAAVVVVTNTVLVSVAQRTREIGIRRALGATRAQVTSEVVAEALLTALVGGTTGVIAAWGVLALASRLTGIELPMRSATIVWSLMAAGGAGVIAGWYPARLAARIDPIEALRQE